jgi:hypothetical protein
MAHPWLIARRLLFTVGALEGLSCGSRAGERGLRGKEGAGDANFASPSWWLGRFFQKMAVRREGWDQISWADDTVSPAQAKDNRQGHRRGGDNAPEQARYFACPFE